MHDAAGSPKIKKGKKVAAINKYVTPAGRFMLDCNTGTKKELIPNAKPIEKNIKPMNDSGRIIFFELVIINCY